MKEEFNNIKFEEVAFPRYIKVKESIESLTKIIDYEKVKEDGIDRVLHAILQLIDENDDKTVDEKKELIEEAIYKGNVFKHYFSEDNQEKAVEILSNTSLLNDEERLIYIINFFMPSDVNFSNIYSMYEKNIALIAEHYGLNESDSNNLVYARVAEISMFHKLYQEEKERQKIQNSNSGNLEVPVPPEYEPQIEELFIPEISISEDISEDVSNTSEESNLIEEPKPLDETLEEATDSTLEESEEIVGKDVMQSLQTLVATAKENSKKVEQLSLDLEEHESKIVELNGVIEAKDAELENKNKELEAKKVELDEKNAELDEANSIIKAKDAEIKTLTTSLKSYKNSLGEIQKFLSSAQNIAESPKKTKKVA